MPALVFTTEDGRSLAAHKLDTYDDLLTACEAAVKCVEAMIDRIDEECGRIGCYCGMPGNEPHSQTYRDNELAMLTAAIRKARGGE